LFDVPELLPRATPGQREIFERRCQTLYQEALPQNGTLTSHGAVPQLTKERLDDLLKMFPSMQTEVIQTLAGEAASFQQLVEWLLTLSTDAAADQATAKQHADEAPDISDTSTFPVLLDSDGWQVVGQSNDQEGETSQTWSDRVRSAAALTTPPQTKSAPAPCMPFAGQRRTASGCRVKHAVDEVPLTEYEARHLDGQNRVRQRAAAGARRRKQLGHRSGWAASSGWGTDSEPEDVIVAPAPSNGSDAAAWAMLLQENAKAEDVVVRPSDPRDEVFPETKRT
jgi:hypothetical protein